MKFSEQYEDMMSDNNIKRYYAFYDKYDKPAYEEKLNKYSNLSQEDKTFILNILRDLSIQIRKKDLILSQYIDFMVKNINQLKYKNTNTIIEFFKDFEKL